MITRGLALWGGGSALVATVATGSSLYLSGGGAVQAGAPGSVGVANARGPHPTGSAAPAGHPLTVTGVVSGQLAPGRPQTLTVTIDNAKNQAIKVVSVTASITSLVGGSQPGKPNCNKDWFSVGSFSGAQLIAKGAKGTVALPINIVNLPTVNQDNCKSATFGLAFTARADEA